MHVSRGRDFDQEQLGMFSLSPVPCTFDVKCQSRDINSWHVIENAAEIPCTTCCVWSSHIATSMAWRNCVEDMWLRKRSDWSLPNCVLPIIFNQPTGVKDIIGHLFQIKEFQTQFEAWNRLLENCKVTRLPGVLQGSPPRYCSGSFNGDTSMPR